MDFNKHFETGWRKTLELIGPVVLVTLVQVTVTIFSLGILGPVTMAGYMKSLLKTLREDRIPEVGDLFSEMSLFLPLTLYGLAVILVSFIGFALLILPGIAVVLTVSYASFYLLPLMIDTRLPLLEALKKSWEIATIKPISDQIIIFIIVLAIMSLGGSIPLVILVCQPVATFVLLSVYKERMQGVLELAGATETFWW